MTIQVLKDPPTPPYCLVKLCHFIFVLLIVQNCMVNMGKSDTQSLTAADNGPDHDHEQKKYDSGHHKAYKQLWRLAFCFEGIVSIISAILYFPTEIWNQKSIFIKNDGS